METSSYNISQYCNTNTRYKTNKNILWTNHRLLGSINGKRRQTVWPRDKFPSDCAPRFQNSLSKRILSTISTAFYCLDCCLPRKFIEESYRVESRLIGKSSIERSRENDKGKLCVMSRRGRYRARRTLKTSWKLHQLDRRKVLFFLLVEESRSRRTRQRSHSRQPTTPLQRSFAFCCFVCSVSSSLSPLSLSHRGWETLKEIGRVGVKVVHLDDSSVTRSPHLFFVRISVNVSLQMLVSTTKLLT